MIPLRGGIITKGNAKAQGLLRHRHYHYHYYHNKKYRCYQLPMVLYYGNKTNESRNPTALAWLIQHAGS